MFVGVQQHPDLLDCLGDGIIREVDVANTNWPVRGTTGDSARLGKDVLENIGKLVAPKEVAECFGNHRRRVQATLGYPFASQRYTNSGRGANGNRTFNSISEIPLKSSFGMCREWSLDGMIVEHVLLLRETTIRGGLVIEHLQDVIGGVQVISDNALLLMKLYLQNVITREPVIRQFRVCAGNQSLIFA